MWQANLSIYELIVLLLLWLSPWGLVFCALKALQQAISEIRKGGGEDGRA